MIQELKHQIQEEIEWISVEMLETVMGDINRRLAKCIHKNGGHLKDIVFGQQDFS